MKEVLISIRPQWCEKIASGEKTIEVRKTAPKIQPPFKCYIYMTKGFASYPVGNGMWCHNNGGMVVIGEFVCDFVLDIYPPFGNKTEGTCLSASEMYEYAGGKQLYGWHISNLELYNKPKSLSEFRMLCKEYDKDSPYCDDCEYYYCESNESVGFYDECTCDGLKHMTRPPQSWCYVKGGEGDDY